MEEQLFVRIRGHVQGPFELEKLRALVRRGQLSRMHEVSSDGSVWKPASNFPDLFMSPTIQGVQVGSESQVNTRSSGDDVPGLEDQRSSGLGRWHFAQNDTQKGPVSFDELKAIIASGNLDAADLVWTDGMKEWVPAQSIAGLVASNGAGFDRNAGSTGKLDRDIVRTHSESTPWVKFIASVMCFLGLLGIVLGATGVVMGARWNEAGIIASGGFSILYGAVFLWGSQLLFRYCTDVGRLVREASMRRLDSSLRSLRRFWIYLSIILIVLLVNALGLAIWAFSIGVSLSGTSR